MQVALPREALQFGDINGLAPGLGEDCITEFQSFSAADPKPSSSRIDRWYRNFPDLVRVVLDRRNTINAGRCYRDGIELNPSKSRITLVVKNLPVLPEAKGRALSHDLEILDDWGGQ